MAIFPTKMTTFVGGGKSYQVHKLRKAPSHPTTDDLPRVFYLRVKTQSVLPFFIKTLSTNGDQEIYPSPNCVRDWKFRMCYYLFYSSKPFCNLSLLSGPANLSAPAEQRETLRGPYQQRACTPLLVFTRWVPVTRQHQHKRERMWKRERT